MNTASDKDVFFVLALKENTMNIESFNEEVKEYKIGFK